MDSHTELVPDPYAAEKLDLYTQTVPEHHTDIDDNTYMNMVIHTNQSDPESGLKRKATTEPNTNPVVPTFPNSSHNATSDSQCEELEIKLDTENGKEGNIISISTAEDEKIMLNRSHQTNREVSEEQNKHPDHEMQTRLGKAIAVVLGNTLEVKKLDEKHKLLKQSANQNMEKEKDYLDMLAPVQAQVLQENQKAHTSLLQWEKEYCLKNNLSAPSYTMMKTDATASILLRKIKHSSALLKHWNIHF